MIYLPHQTPNNLSPLENWQDKVLLDKKLSQHLEGYLEIFSDDFFCLQRAWISQQARQQLKKGQAISVDDKIIAAPYNFLEIEKQQKVFQSNDSFTLDYPWQIINLSEQIIDDQLQKDKILGEFSPSANKQGIVHLGKGSRILPGVYIEGKVSIGENCKIGPNCYLRGATFIGDNCHVGQSVEIKNSYIMNNTNIGHLSYIGDSIIAENVNFGAGTVVANLRHDNKNHFIEVDHKRIDTKRRKLGVIVGNNVHTGINTSFYPATIVHSHALIKPAEVISNKVLLK